MIEPVSQSSARQVSAFRVQPGLRAVVSGPGCVAERLGDELASIGITKPLLVCGAQLARSPVLEITRRALRVEAALFEGSRPHTPIETVAAGAHAARAARADGIVAVGGSSAVDCAKGIAVLLASGREEVSELEPLRFERLFDPPAESFPRIPLVAVTTTLSFAEFLPFWGARDPERLRKLPYSDLHSVERTIFLDGELAAHTPDRVWFETGIKALDDAVAAWCRGTAPEPFGDPLLAEAIRDLVELLPRSGGTSSSPVRQRILTACWMTKLQLPRLGAVALPAWFSTTARHSIGAVHAAPHGAASCVALPHALHFHADATRGRQATLAAALDWPTADTAPLWTGLDRLLSKLRVPRSLGALGMKPPQLAELVTAMRAEAPQLGDDATLREACERML